jgi:ribonuclease P protein component
MKREDFPKKIKVKKSSEFHRIIKSGAKKLGENIILYRLRSSEEGQKFGIKISKGIKEAVKKNKIKRIIRETLRKNKDKFDPHEKVVVLVKLSTKCINGRIPDREIDLDKLKEELGSLIQ